MLDKLKIQENVPLAPMTTLKIGGMARFFVCAESEAEVVQAFKFAKKNDFELFILGGGSNVLISDKGFDGLVLQISLKGISIIQKQDEVFSIKAKAGEDWDEFVAFCVNKNLSGLECLSGIPGFVGGTPIQNVGAYGQEVSETIVRVRVFDRKSKQILEFSKSECEFKYRQSIFNTSEKNRFIVLSVTFELIHDGAPKIVYKDLIEFFGDSTPNLQETRDAVLKIRSAKSMVIDKNDINSQSAGSFFKNPVVSNEEFEEIKKALIIKGIITNEENVPFFKVDDQNIKIPAAWIIEKSGFYKGFERGNAGLSSKHTLAIINRGNAKADDIIQLMNEIQNKVRDGFDVQLDPEPIFVGF
jgi:UDP-N-acetylmuramate dehydrogenase